MTQLDYSQPLYYRNSGRTPVGRLVVALLVILPAAAITGALYSLISSYLPMLHFAKLVLIVEALLMAGFAFGVGGLTFKLLLWARVRNLAMVWLVAGLAALVAWYVDWVTWEWHLFIRDPDADLPKFALFRGLLLHPQAVWHFATEINRVGTFGISDDMIKGPFLWVLWLVEAVVVLGVATVLPYRMIRGLAFCESCNQWGRVREGVMSVGPAADEERLRARLALRDLSALEELGPANLNAPQRLRVDLQNCPTCDTMHLLSVQRIDVTFKNGQRSEKVRPIVDRLRVGPEEVRAVEEIRDRINGGGAAVATGEVAVADAAPEPATGSSPPASEATPDAAGSERRVGL